MGMKAILDRWIRVFDDPHFHVYLATVMVISFFLANFFWTKTNLLSLVIAAGMGGGVISTYIRVKGSTGQSSYDGAPGIPKLQAYISPLVAGMLALVFHGFLASGIVTGHLFPKFIGDELKYNSLPEMLKLLAPDTNRDAAKAVVWAFVAGFSERLVPNVLDMVTKKDAPMT